MITVDDIPFRCNSVFNAGAVMYDSQYILLLRVEDLKGRSVFALARSDDGFHFTVDPEPAMEPSTEEPFRTYERRCPAPAISRRSSASEWYRSLTTKTAHCFPKR
jgi:predicted GH43/DUF377 family glycosyl hydrolase